MLSSQPPSLSLGRGLIGHRCPNGMVSHLLTVVTTFVKKKEGSDYTGDIVTTMNPGSPPTSAGRGTGAGQHGCQGTSRGGRGGRQNTAPIISKHRFDGATEELKGQIFDLVGAHSANLFIKSKKHSRTTSDEHISIQAI